ncbi:hypothetical protein [Sansalvadorimonas verongulae]|uniref:hypothetical protein n=1 Tax=Sansalvadorimonas verongulae TaxID=2172824 RepID=UPI0012BD3221|nr:hypothetical protein [Sansalvadorimonas verongulae]MTI13079.1 hypothetical protein [Sansalvadorimonas verongulae]
MSVSRGVARKWLPGLVLAACANVSHATETKRVKVSEIFPGSSPVNPSAFTISTVPVLKRDCPMVRIPWIYRDDVHDAQLNKQPVRFKLSSSECLQFGDKLYLNALGVILSNDEQPKKKSGVVRIGKPVKKK